MSKASLIDNKKNNIDLVLSPIKDTDLITDASIYELIKASGYEGLYVDTSNIKNAIAELNSVLKPLQDLKTGREVRYQILERRDATIEIKIENDEMSASAEILTAQGGKNLTAKAILNFAQSAGVTKGFSKEELISLAKRASLEPAGSIVIGKIALGKEAINGKDAKIKMLVESAQERILRPTAREDGTVDMRDLGDIICVNVGDPLAQRIPLTEGINGYTVTGSPTSPTPGEDITMTVGEGTILSQNNNDILISTLVGLPSVIDNGVEVNEVYQLNNVDVSTGHIKFEGSVIINGDVCEGMRVSATGDITVGGFIESALLDAGGDITISGGIIGRKQEVEDIAVSDIIMSANIRCNGNVFAKYCQYAAISCKNLRIENQLMHSIINVEERLWLGSEDKADGKLIAGYISAGTSVHAGIVGATAGSTTIISFDKKITLFKEQLDDIDVRLKIETDKTNELQAAANKLKKLPKSSANTDMLTKVISTYRHHANQMGAVLNEKEKTENQLQAYMLSVYIEATDRIYQGVELIVGDYHDKTKREYGPSKMNYKERKIHIDPIINA
ncbi:MAG: hypothetical protein ACI9LM_003283 [Alteromonadaceae bacterium]